MRNMIKQAKATLTPEGLVYFYKWHHMIERDMQNAYRKGGDSACADVLNKWVILCGKFAKDLENF